MARSQPPIPNSLDAGWELFDDEPAADAEEPAADSDDTRTVQLVAPIFLGSPWLEESTSDDRDTMPPPVPVAEYVQTMMQQAVEEADLAVLPIASAFAWPAYDRSATPAYERGEPSPHERATVPPVSPRHRSPSPQGPPSPPARADVPAAFEPSPVPAPADDNLSFELVAFEPERLGGAVGDLDDPRFVRGLEPASGFDDLPFDDVIAASERAGAADQYATPLPPRPSSRAPSTLAPRLRATVSDFAAVRPNAVPARGLGAPARPVDPPQTQRGVASPRAPSRRGGSTREFASVGDASVRARLPSAPLTPLPAARRPPEPVDPFDDVRELYDAGDFRSALVMAEAFLETAPDHPEARACAAGCRETLATKYLSRLGGLTKILRVAMPPDEIRWLSLDHKAGFLLACIDGTSTIEEVLDVACMQEFEAIRILHDFRELGVIEILADPRAPRR